MPDTFLFYFHCQIYNDYVQKRSFKKDYTTKLTVKTNDTISSTQLLPAVQLKWVGFVLNGKRFLLNHFVAQGEVIDNKKE